MIQSLEIWSCGRLPNVPFFKGPSRGLEESPKTRRQRHPFSLWMGIVVILLAILLIQSYFFAFF